MLPACQLCQTKPADKENSHIISKFITKRLFPTKDPDPQNRQAIKILRGTEFKVQTTPKPDNIFCSDCETRFANVEALLAQRFNEILNHESNSAAFNYYVGESHGEKIEYMEHKTLPISHLRAFLFSLLWRASISDDEVYGAFKLEPEIEENIRTFLDSTLKSTHAELLTRLETKDSLPFSFILMKPKQLKSTPGMGLTAVAADNVYRIYMADYILICEKCSDGNPCELDKVPISLLNNESWMKCLIAISSNL